MWCSNVLQKVYMALPKYNFQLHQLLFEPCQQNDQTRLRYTDIAVLHFSGKVKPSNFNMKSGSPKLVTLGCSS